MFLWNLCQQPKYHFSLYDLYCYFRF
jgi:hypothetical protein